MSVKIEVDYIAENIGAEFVPYYPGKRLYLYDKDTNWYPALGWCPHRNLGWGECTDCALVLDED